MDFGSAFLEKFEEHYGKWPCRILLGAFGLAGLGFCTTLIMANIIVPLSEIYSQIVSDRRSIELLKIINVLILISGLIYFLFLIVQMRDRKEELRAVQKYRDEYEEYIKFVEDFYAHSEAIFASLEMMRANLEARLTKASKAEIGKSLDEMGEKLAEGRSLASDKVIALNARITGDPIDKADAPLISDFDANEVQRSPEEGI